MMSAARGPDEFLAEIVSQFAPAAQVLFHPSRELTVTDHLTSARISFSRGEIDDLAEALKRPTGTAYFANLERHIRIRVAISLMRSGITPDLRLAEELMRGGDEWPANKFVDIALLNPFAQIIVGGMRSLHEALTTLIANSPIEVPAIAEDAANVHYLIKYYEEAANLSSPRVGKENLGYIKGAAICAIALLEEKRRATRIDRIKAAINQQIVSISEWVEDDPYAKIQTPQCVIEYIQAAHTPERTRVEVPRLDTMLATSSDRLDEYLEALGPQFTRRRQGAWEAFRSDNPDKLSQASNSMVELLDKVLGRLCEGTTMEKFLVERFGDSDEHKWVEATRKWISETKSNLHRVKHHDDYTSAKLIESLMKSAENVMELLLAKK
jgi:hypothetical protein